MGILILVHPVPDPTNLHAEILRRMRSEPYLLRIDGFLDDITPTREQIGLLGATIAEYVMEQLYPITGTHLDICQLRPIVQPDERFTFQYHLRWEEQATADDQTANVVVDAAQGAGPAANVVIYCQVLRLNALVAFIPNFAWEKHGGDFKAIATTVI